MGLLKKIIFSGFFSVLLAMVWVTPAQAAKLFLSPSSGTFTVGSTFDVDILLNTEGKSINTVSAVLLFPQDKLQLVSPTIGQSVISVWTAQPVFNNQSGTIKVVGGIPGGINVQSGLITSLKFRVKQVSDSAIVRFSDESRVLANDGTGKDVLSIVQSGVYRLILPPPQGPIVSSETHSDQSKWYQSKDVILNWAGTEAVESYSYVLDRDPAGVPDNIAEENKTTVVYKNLDEGTHYFHIKSMRNGAWGGVTSFGINVDSQAPAEFAIKFAPSARTSSSHQIVNFQTSDTMSGVSYYEMKVIPLTPTASIEKNNTNFFVETTSPYQLALDLGKYDIIIRAYDNAGNFREETGRLNVVVPLFELVNDKGVKFGGWIVMPWSWFWVFSMTTIVMLIATAWHFKKWHHGFAHKKQSNELPADVKAQLETLRAYRKKYNNLMLLMVLLLGSLFVAPSVKAQNILQSELPPPIISSVSKHISNEEIFYIGGKTTDSEVSVMVYLQNTQSGEILSNTVISDSKGNWFYRHPTFLSSGEYLLWTQSKSGEKVSAPSSQIQMTVQKTAIQLGASRLSFETIYLGLVIVFLIIIMGLIVFISYHIHHGRKKHKLFWKEIWEAEESIRRGFAVLKRDIESELSLIRRANIDNNLMHEIQEKEAHLLKDLAVIQQHIRKEIWDVEKAGS